MQNNKQSSISEALSHKSLVKTNMSAVCRDLTLRARTHDDSKLHEPEKSHFADFKERLDNLEYGTKEYEECLDDMKDIVLDLHYSQNDHHPEHFERGLIDMNLFQLIEMMCDWLAVCKSKNEDLLQSVEYGRKRFDMSPDLYRILKNTAKYMLELDK